MADSLSHREPTKGNTVIIVALVALVVLSSWGTAYELQMNVINRPVQLTGVCDPPAVIQGGGCYIVQTTTDQNGNTHTTLIPAGHIVVNQNG